MGQRLDRDSGLGRVVVPLAWLKSITKRRRLDGELSEFSDPGSLFVRLCKLLDSRFTRFLFPLLGRRSGLWQGGH